MGWGINTITSLFQPEIEVSKGTIYSQPGSNVTLSCFITGVVAVVVYDYDDFDDDVDYENDVDDAPAYRDIVASYL